MKPNGGLSRFLGGLLILALLAGAVVLLFAPSSTPAEGASVASTREAGRRALLLVLRELGFSPKVWQRAPISLPRGEHVLWLSQPPLDLEGLAEGGDDQDPGADPERDDPSLADPRHPWNYALFVRGGGTLVVPGDDEMLEWLREGVGLEVPAWHGLAAGAGVEALQLDTGEALQASVQVAASDEGGRLEDWHDVATDEEGRAFAAWCEVGDGRVMVLAGDGFLANGALNEAQNGLLAVRLVESLDRGGALLFDEYALGRWQPPTSVGLLAAPGLREVTWHVLFFALCVLGFSAWAREFPRDPEPLYMNPRLRAKAGARLLERARRYDLLARELRLGTLRRLARRWKLSRRASALGEDAEPQELAGVAREVARRAGRAEELAASWARLFGDTSTRSSAEFEALSRRLQALELELES